MGEPKKELRKNSWYLLRFLRAQLDYPWICLDDFNEVLLQEEHFGGIERERWQIEQFQDVVAECGFSDLGFSGLPYTWVNRQDGNRNVKVILDRALGDTKFVDRLGATRVIHIPTTSSDHSALLVEIRADNNQIDKWGKLKPFRYENM
jgi:hypothetical protein